MLTEFRLPDLGENIESGDVVSVLVKEGDAIRADQGVLEIETGKAVVEVPCPTAGTIAKINVAKGQKISVGDVVLTLEPVGVAANGDSSNAAPATKPVASVAKPPAADAAVNQPARTAVPQAPARAPAAPIAATSASLLRTPPAGPATRRLARELGVDLGRVDGTGSGGRITEDDVKAAVREVTAGAAPHVAASPTSPAAAPRPRPAPSVDGTPDRDPWGNVRRQKMTQIRYTIAVNMARNAATIPHVTNFDDADITELERIRKGGLADYAGTNVKLTMMAFVLKAVAQSLRLHPMLNASVDMETREIAFKQYVHLGVAVDTDRGLVVPAIRDVDQLSIPRIAAALQTVAERARAGQLTLDEMRGQTFTISNLGAVGGVYSTPIINSPDVAILLVGRSRKLPVVIEDRIEPRLMMPLSLSYDHRVVDGAAAARFLNEVISYLTVPGRLLLAP